MKITSKKIYVACCFICMIFCGTALADDLPGKPKQAPPNIQSFDEIKAIVASILSKYDPNALTAENARAINNAFRAAGVRQGPAQKQAIAAAGFDPHKISSLDPPPEKMGQGKQGQGVKPQN